MAYSMKRSNQTLRNSILNITCIIEQIEMIIINRLICIYYKRVVRKKWIITNLLLWVVFYGNALIFEKGPGFLLKSAKHMQLYENSEAHLSLQTNAYNRKSLYIYIYIYMCVCVCVCVCARARAWFIRLLDFLNVQNFKQWSRHGVGEITISFRFYPSQLASVWAFPWFKKKVFEWFVYSYTHTYTNTYAKTDIYIYVYKINMNINTIYKYTYSIYIYILNKQSLSIYMYFFIYKIHGGNQRCRSIQYEGSILTAIDV